jgi:hypothetical protein
MPQEQNLAIFRGRTVEIPLRALGRAPTQLRFLIRTKPQHGRLGEIRLTGPKSAVVTYTHDEKSSATYDSFTYAVQAVDTAVSAPGEVHLAISEEPAALSVVHAVDFGRVWIGETREEEITLRNTGGGALAGRMIVSEPWRVLGSPEFRLARREEKKVRLVFAPADPGEFAVRLVFSHDPRAAVSLTGAAEAPLEVLPEKELTLADTGTVRSGTLTVRNCTPSERLVEISAPDELVVAETLRVPAGSEVAVPVEVRAGLLAPVDDRLDLQSGGFQRSVPVRAVAAPPVLQADPAGGWNLGAVETRSVTEGSLTLRNAGGRDARLVVDGPSQIRLVPDPAGVVLGPGQSRTFGLEFETSGTGAFSGTLSVAAEGAETLRLPLRADVRAAPGAAKRRPAGDEPEIAPARPDKPERKSVPWTEEIAAAPLNAIPPLTGITSRAISRSAVEFRWKKPAGAVAPVVEYRVIDPNGPKVRWVAWKGLEAREENGEMVVTLGNLPRGWTWYLRFVSLDDAGRRSLPSDVMRLSTPAPPPTRWPYWVLGGGGVALAAALYRVHRRREEARAAEETDRLNRLTKS